MGVVALTEDDVHLLERDVLHPRRPAATEDAAQLGQVGTERSDVDAGLMAIQKVDAEAAFTVLVEESQRQNVKLREVAEQVVKRVLGS